MSAPRVPGAAVAAVLLLGAAAPACLFTDPINQPPTVGDFHLSPAVPTRGQTVSVSADATDPNGDRLRYEWSSADGACPVPLDPSLRPPTEQTTPTYSFTLSAQSNDTRCVWLLVSDQYGAHGPPKAISVTPHNRAPVAVIDVQQPARNALGRYDLFSTFRLSSAGSHDDDHDALTPRWTLQAPDAAIDAKLVACSPTPPAEVVQCFTAGQQPGDYQVQLIVNDGITDSEPFNLTLTVDPDSPPCITATAPLVGASPLVLDPAQPADFSILNVRDDGDPFPPSTEASRGGATFNWFVRQNGGVWRSIAGFENLATLTIAADTFISGDQIDVRVEARDRDPDHTLSACGDDPLCPLICPQRITWTGDYL